MLISRMTDETREEADGDHAEYQTATELIDLMTKTNKDFNSNGDGALTTRDLVLLYKNIDIGTKLMSDAGVTTKKPNQHVETVVYHDAESESDISDITGTDDIYHLFSVNQERMDFLDDQSYEHLLCQKLGGMEIKSSMLAAALDDNCSLKNPFTSLNMMAGSVEFDKTFSTSLLDYICCKRMEDNYNFHIDNIITYVQVTIEQLKRISNGDYLTDRVKEKWREVTSSQDQNYTKVLATSASIPLHVLCKRNEVANWDDLVHSDVDLRSLSTILEKKIVVEIPKLICGSYRLYSKRFSDNLLISCQRDCDDTDSGEKDRVDVVLKLQRSQSGQVMSNISSIMFVRKVPALAEISPKVILPLMYAEETNEEVTNQEYSKEPTVKICELDQCDDIADLNTETEKLEQLINKHRTEYDSQNEKSYEESIEYPFSEYDRNASCEFMFNPDSSESSIALKDRQDKPIFSPCTNEIPYNFISTNELRFSMHKLNLKSVDEIGEESSSLKSPKRRSPMRVRIKSPYENKSFLLEEKKRKRLLEIRERRERKKIALSENCKISKYKYGRGSTTAQATNSMTKLSISNKSFYNSIYGQTIAENTSKGKPTDRRSPRALCIPRSPVSPTPDLDEEYIESPMLTPGKNGKKYINRSYYLDEAETEMMYIQLKRNQEKDFHGLPPSATNSNASNEFNVDLLTKLFRPAINFDSEDIDDHRTEDNHYTSIAESNPEDSLIVLPLADSVNDSILLDGVNDVKTQLAAKKSSTDECRKSIDQLYDLIKTIGKSSAPTDVPPKSKLEVHFDMRHDVGGGSVVQSSGSGSSLKRRSPPPNLSGPSEKKTASSSTSKSARNRGPVVPKVIINTKPQSPKTETNQNLRKNKSRARTGPGKTGSESNPLKAISQLLHDFDTVQRARLKPEPKPSKKVEVPVEKFPTRQASQRRHSRLDRHLKEELDKKTTSTVSPREKSNRPVPPLELARLPCAQAAGDDRRADKSPKKKLVDIMDEVKEARGEAVRGPSKLSSRLDSLAQPRKWYVQAHQEEHLKYGRPPVGRPRPTTEPARAAGAGTPPRRAPARRPPAEGTLPVLVKLPASSQQIERGGKTARARRSNSGSPNDPQPSFMHPTPEPSDPTLNKKSSAMKSFVKLNLHSMPISADAHNAPRAPLARDLQLESPRFLGRPRSPDMSAYSLGGVITGLSSLIECSESSPLKRDSDSDYQPDITEENLETAVNSLPETEQRELMSSTTSPSHVPDLELERLESALYGQLAVSPKRLRIKTLTLTPKHSTQRVFFVHSGDACTTDLQEKKCSPPQRDIRSMAALSNPRLAWTAAIPFQIATVGYAFPTYTRDPMLLPRRMPNSDPVVTIATQRLEAVEAVEAVEASVQVAGTDFSKLVPETRTESCGGLVAEVHCSTKPALEIPTGGKSQEPAEHATSLDTLVALLNEIHKITCPNHVAPPTCNTRESRETSVVKLFDTRESKETPAVKPLHTHESRETSLHKPHAKPLQIGDRPPSRELVAIKSFTGIVHPQSDPNIYSFCMFDERTIAANSAKSKVSNFMLAIDVRNGESTQMVNNIMDLTLVADEPSRSVDKEVSANTCEIKYVDTFTDPPSKLCFWDNTAGTSTTSISEMTSEPLLLSLAPYDPKFRSTSVFRTESIEPIIGLPAIEAKPNTVVSQIETGSTVELSQSETSHIIELPATETKTIKDVTQNSFIEISQVKAKPVIALPLFDMKRFIEVPQIETNRVNELPQIKPVIELPLIETKKIVEEQQIGTTTTLNQLPQVQIENIFQLQQTDAKYIMKLPQMKSSHIIKKQCIEESMIEVPQIKTKRVIEMPHTETKHVIELSQIKTSDSLIKFPRRDADLKNQCFETGHATVHNIVDVKKDRSVTTRCGTGSKIIRKYSVKNIDLDPMLKIKRDVLVTVYSILVLTVFAALSFPDLIASRIV